MFAFEMNEELLEEFYRRAKALGAQTEEQKTHILLQMVQEGLIKNALSTNATKEEFVKAVSKHFNVTNIGETTDESKTKGDADSGQAGTLGN